MISSEDESFAERAAAWAAGFNRGVKVTVEGGRVTLSSDSHSEMELRAIWRSALLNERLLVRAAGGRAGVIEMLIA